MTIEKLTPRQLRNFLVHYDTQLLGAIALIVELGFYGRDDYKAAIADAADAAGDILNRPDAERLAIYRRVNDYADDIQEIVDANAAVYDEVVADLAKADALRTATD